MTHIEQKDLSPVQADAMSAMGGNAHIRRPAVGQWLKERTWMTFGMLRRALVKPARLFHSKSEADRVRHHTDEQRLKARHFRGGTGF